MRLLVITYNALMASTPNGRTMVSLLDGYSADEIYNFCVTGIPDEEYCSHAYKVTNKDALKSFFLRKEYGNEISPQKSIITNESLANDVYKGDKSPWKYWAREVFWKNGKWNGSNLKDWLKKHDFDCVIYMYGDGAALQDFAVFVSDFLHIPLLVYACEEYCFKDYNYINQDEKSLFFKKYFQLSTDATKRLFSKCRTLICNSDQLGQLYKETYGIDMVATVMMASNMDFNQNTAVPPVDEMRISYCGSLGKARNQALIDVAEALNQIDSNLKLDVYGRADSETENMMKGCPQIRFHGFVSYEDVVQIQHESTLIIQATTTDSYQSRDRRFGFSTKNADSLACGTPYFIYEDPAIVEMKFVKEHDCAFFAEKEDQLVEVLKTALFNEQERILKVQNARKVTQQYFNKTKNIRLVHSMVENLVELWN